jgi:PAS domain S-box-containing protein
VSSLQIIRVGGEKIRFSSNPEPMWIFDQQTLAFREVNAAAIQKYGYSRDEFLEMTILDIRPPGDVPKLLRSAAHPHNRHSSHDEKWSHLEKNGTVIPVSITSYEIVFEGRPGELVLAHDLRGEKK